MKNTCCKECVAEDYGDPKYALRFICINRKCECHSPAKEPLKENQERMIIIEEKSDMPPNAWEKASHPKDSIEGILNSKEHRALALELPEEVYDAYTSSLRTQLVSFERRVRGEERDRIVREVNRLMVSHDEYGPWYASMEELKKLLSSN